MPTVLTSDTQLAADLVVSAGRLAVQLRRQDLRVQTKTSTSDLVTEADHQAEHAIRTMLAEHRPNDGLLGEEGTLVSGTTSRRWVIDPVDGTYNFVAGSDYWCTAVALVDSQEDSTLGAVYRPDTGDLTVGGAEVPTTLNGRELPQLTPNFLAASSVATYLHPTFYSDEALFEPFRRVIESAATLRMLGSGSVDLATVASGVHSAWFQHSCPEWDWLPGKALIEGAGGICTSVEVNGYDWFVAGRPGVIDEVVALLKKA